MRLSQVTGSKKGTIIFICFIYYCTAKVFPRSIQTLRHLAQTCVSCPNLKALSIILAFITH